MSAAAVIRMVRIVIGHRLSHPVRHHPGEPPDRQVLQRRPVRRRRRRRAPPLPQPLRVEVPSWSRES